MSKLCPAHLLLLDKVHEVGPLDLHRLTLAVVQSQDEVEEVGLAQVGGWLLLEMRAGQTHAAAGTEARRCRRWGDFLNLQIIIDFRQKCFCG